MINLTNFREAIVGFDEKAGRASALLPFLGFLLEENETAVTGANILALFDELRLRRPSRISDMLKTSTYFVRSKSGPYHLSHSGQQYVLANLKQGRLSSPIVKGSAVSRDQRSDDPAESHSKNQEVFVVYGRDEELRLNLFSLLRALGCHPLEFSEIVHKSESASPYTWNAIHEAFEKAQACVVLFSPDESAELRTELQHPKRHEEGGLQPRQNVLIEAGMAMALQPNRTVLIRVGDVRDNSDFAGRQYIDLDGSASSRNKLRNALEKAGCQVSTRGDDWLSIGMFKPKGEIK